jgi:hypothetical protein
MKLTPWFKWPLTPARAGYYEFRGLDYETPVRMPFNGCTFGWPDPTDGKWVVLADDQRDEWRGLAVPDFLCQPLMETSNVLDDLSAGTPQTASMNEVVEPPQTSRS